MFPRTYTCIPQLLLYMPYLLRYGDIEFGSHFGKWPSPRYAQFLKFPRSRILKPYVYITQINSHDNNTTTRDVRWEGDISQVNKHYDVRKQSQCFQRCLASVRCFAALYMPTSYMCYTTTDTTHRTVDMSKRHPGFFVYYRVNKRCPGT